MNGHPQSAPAKVLAFPAGGRAGLARSSAKSRYKFDNANKSFERVDYDSWYHADAVTDDKTDKDS